MSSIQYTLRNVPRPVDAALRERAKKQGKSFNQTAIDALKQATGKADKPVLYSDLDWFIGSGNMSQKQFDKSQQWLNRLPNKL